MQRAQATKELRALLDAQGLPNWHLRLTADIRAPLGLCSYKDKCIILNALHIDSHPDVEIINTIRHEVAHALVGPGFGHGDVWKEKAKELGCDNTQPCASFGFNEAAIDAIRSGADVEVSFEEEVIRTPKYTINRLQDKCAECGKVAKVVSSMEFKTPKGRQKLNTLACGHVVIVPCDSQSPFEDFVFDGSLSCIHVFGTGRDRTTCQKCGAHKLYEFQIEGARNIERANGRHALLHEQGLGKTIQFLAWLKYNPQAFPYVWVTKSGAKYQHAKEILRLLGPDYFPQVITTGKQQLIPTMKGYMLSWDMFRRIPDLSIFSHAQSLFLDECQAMKNPDSARTQAIRKVAKNIPRIVPASGTFWKNRGSEAFVMFNMLAPSRFYSFEHFKRKDVQYYYKGDKLKEGGLRPNLMNEVQDIATRRERKEVMPELPLISRRKLTCEVPAHVRATYQTEEDKMINILNQLVMDGQEDTFKGSSALNDCLMVMRQIVGIAKVDTTVEFAKEFLEETDRKLVVFVHHKECHRLIMIQMRAFCAENEMPEPLELVSSMSPEERSAIQDKFNSKDYRFMVASTLASGEALNLQTCSDCVMHERQWNPANEEQAEGRFIRIGQEAECVTATYVHGDDTCDTELDSIVENKRIQWHNSMNKGDMPIWNQDSIIMELAKRIAAKRKSNGKTNSR